VPIPPADPDFVYLPVPRSRVIEVMRLLSSGPQQMEEDPDTPVPASAAPPRAEETPGDESPEDWDESALHDLARWAPPKQALVLQYLAQRAGEVVTAWELREYLVAHRDISDISVERSGRALGAVMAALRKRSAWYDGRDFPFSAEWDDRRGENVYRMGPDHAGPILAALREHRPDEMGGTD
jgi:hypothetical protein